MVSIVRETMTDEIVVPNALQKTFATIKEKYGPGTVNQASRGKGYVLRQFQIGIFDVDAAIGGGIPWARFIRIYGPRSGGKTSLALKAVAGAQRYCRYCRERFRINRETGEMNLCACPDTCGECGNLYVKVPYYGSDPSEDDPFDWEMIHDWWTCGDCLVFGATKKKSDRVPKIVQRCGRVRALWLDAEHCYDNDWSARLGVDNDLVYVIQPEYAEQASDIGTELIRSGEIDIVVVDSIAELVPKCEVEASNEDTLVAPLARQVNRMLRRWVSAVNSLGGQNLLKPSIILLNQTRDSLGYGEVTPGGRQQEFRSSIDIRVHPASYKLQEGVLDGTNDSVKWADMSGFVKKNKAGSPMRHYGFKFYLSDQKGYPAGSTQEYNTVVDRAVGIDIIRKIRSNKYEYDREGKTLVWTTKTAIGQAWAEDPDLFWEIRDRAMEHFRAP